jgi:hypothetical protein
MIALVPIFEKERKTSGKNYTQVPKGFEMQKNLHVRYKNAAQLDALFTVAAQCEIYYLIKVENFRIGVWNYYFYSCSTLLLYAKL